MSTPDIETERKYVIRIPKQSDMQGDPHYTRSEIVQTYLISPPLITHRVRKRVFDVKTVYTETKKIRIDEMSSFEDEREIGEDEYLLLLQNKKTGTKHLIKTRHTFLYSGQVFEVDVYPEWKSSCIMETELSSKHKNVEMPPFIEIIREVTGDKKYSNAAMAERFPEELV